MSAFVLLQGIILTLVFGVMRCNAGGPWQDVEDVAGFLLSALVAGAIHGICPKVLSLKH